MQSKRSGFCVSNIFSIYLPWWAPQTISHEPPVPPPWSICSDGNPFLQWCGRYGPESFLSISGLTGPICGLAGLLTSGSSINWTNGKQMFFFVWLVFFYFLTATPMQRPGVEANHMVTSSPELRVAGLAWEKASHVVFTADLKPQGDCCTFVMLHISTWIVDGRLWPWPFIFMKCDLVNRLSHKHWPVTKYWYWWNNLCYWENKAMKYYT